MVKYTSDVSEYNRRLRQSHRDRSALHINFFNPPVRRTTNILPSPRPSFSFENDGVSEHTVATFSPFGYNAPEAEQVAEDMSKPPVSELSTATDWQMAFFPLLNDAKFSDVTLFLGPDAFKLDAHRIILSVSSPYFNDVLRSEFKEGQERELRFEEHSPHALWRVFEYMYKKTYSDEATEPLGEDDPELLKHPRVFALADMFRMDELKILASERFKAQLEKLWISESFPDSIQEVYNSSAPKDFLMKRIVVEISRAHLEDLSKKSAFQEILRLVGDFAVDLVEAVVAHGSRQRSASP